jgi:hypothetical protein
MERSVLDVTESMKYEADMRTEFLALDTGLWSSILALRGSELQEWHNNRRLYRQGVYQIDQKITIVS